jgi:plasmid stabilization system protein ParE
MQPSWHEEAVEELNASSIYYEKKGEGLGERFIGEVESTIARILYAPESLRLFQHGCRKMNLRRFPYSVIYTIRSEQVHIVALMHQARRPGYWKRRSK